MKRRNFIEFLGKGVVATSLLPPFISACNQPSQSAQTFKIDFDLLGISPIAKDDLVLANGLNYEVLLRWGDPISQKDTFGFNNDYLAYIPIKGSEEGILWVNHEYAIEKFVSGFTGGEKTKEQVEKEMYDLGGSLVRIKKEGSGWKLVEDDPYNRRVNGFTKMPFNWDQPIRNSQTAMGTFQNCAGGVTPWGTVLTCEENYQYCYGERNFETDEIIKSSYGYGWEKFYDNPPEHYGWVVEVDPKTGECQKHVALGRCAHECATTIELEDKRVVVYTGDDRNGGCLYKFISDEPGSLKSGTLYVAQTETGKWISLKYEDQPVLQEKYKDQTEVLVRLREASIDVGGTPLARPEDIEIDPVTGHVIVALTNDYSKENFFGELFKVEETDGKFDSLTFKSETFIAGGEESGFACPDNLAFDHAGNLWFTSDISGSAMNQPPYEPFKNNGLFVVPRTGPQQGEVIQIASAPNDSELTGPFFSPDGKTLFLSVQHPGERSPDLQNFTSNWPDGGESMPKPSVVTIQGELLNKIQGLG